MAREKDKSMNRNPRGIGGFKDHPENKANGVWDPKNTQSFCLAKFLAMDEKEFEQWEIDNPKGKRTMAQVAAYERVKQMKKLPDYREVVDRTEGKAIQKIEEDSQRDVTITVEYESKSNPKKTAQDTK